MTGCQENVVKRISVDFSAVVCYHAPIKLLCYGSYCMNTFEEARINAGITIAELATEAKISRSTIEKMQHDKPVKVELAVRACRVLSQYLGREVTYQGLDIKTV